MRTRHYYILLIHDGDEWSPQFGDYSRAVVEQELIDSYKDERAMIITTGDAQESIDAAVIAKNT